MLLASATGTTSTEARRAIETAEGIESCPATEQAWRAGEISSAQAAEIAKTEAVRPGSEAELLDTARTVPLRALKEKAQHRRLTAADPDELRCRQRKTRQVRRWRNQLGMSCISAAWLPETGTAVLSRLDRKTEELRREARRAGREESWEAHAADALAEIILQDGDTPSSVKTDVIFVCDINADRRGHAEDGEPCHAIDGGPVPVEVIKDAVANDAFV